MDERHKNLAIRLSKELFPNSMNNLHWKSGIWMGGTEIWYMEDKEKWYYQQGSSIWVQPKKDGNIPYCYGCGERLMIRIDIEDVYDKKIKDLIEEKTEIPYCPNENHI